MKAITVDWPSSSKFRWSARLTSQTALITAENDHGVDYRGLTDSPAALAGKCVGVYLQADTDATALHLGLQRHEPPVRNYTPRRVTPAVVGLRLDGEAGSLHDD
jgi:non-ribosomal peptide synthetase component F